MAKKQAKKKAAKVSPAALLDDLKAAVIKDKADGIIYSGDDHGGTHVGVPLPSLSFEYLFCSNVMFLGAMYGLAGPPQSYKSNLALELGKQIVNMGGMNAVCETEGGKISPTVLERIYGEKAPYVQLNCVDSIEKAQKYLTTAFKWYDKKWPKHDQLFGFFCDSLNGSNSEETAQKIAKEGSVGRSFPVEAMLWTNWIKDRAPKLAGWPVVFIAVNHEKEGVDENKTKRHPGGVAQEFHSTVYMRITRVRTNEGVEQIVNHLQVSTTKHSFGLPRRRINVPFVVDKTTEPPRLFFDWGHSTADLLADKKHHGAVLKDIIQVTASGESMTGLTRTFNCERLGLKGVTGAELGAAVHANAGLMSELRKALYIREYEVWKGVVIQPPAAVEVPGLEDVPDDDFSDPGE
jgi:hypothetical protein